MERFSKLAQIQDGHYLILKSVATSGIESCGILVGHIKDNVAHIDEVRKIRNISDRPQVEFIFDPTEYLDAILDTDWYTENARYKLLGIWHVHPNVPGYPSTQDWRAAQAGKVIEGLYLIFTTLGDTIYKYYWDGEKFTVIQETNDATR